MVDSRGPLGGVCLNVGCIPSKALLHAAKVIAETKEMSHAGLTFTAPTIDLDALRGWKDGVVTRLTGGLTGLAKQRKVQTLVGTGTFTSPNMLTVAGPDGSTTTVSFDSAIIAAGSEPVHAARSSRTTTPGSSTPPARWTWTTSPSGCWCSAAGSSAWRWPRVYSELGTKISRGRADGPAHPRRGQGPRHPADQTDRQGLRRDLAGHQGHRRRPPAPTGSPSPSTPPPARTRPRPPRPRCSTRCWSPSGAAPTAR